MYAYIYIYITTRGLIAFDATQRSANGYICIHVYIYIYTHTYREREIDR